MHGQAGAGSSSPACQLGDQQDGSSQPASQIFHQPLPSSWGTVCFGLDPRQVNDQTLTIRQTNPYELSPSGAGSASGNQYQTVSAFVSRGQYEQLARENIRLAQELQQAKKDVETLKKACQDLSIWAYQERTKLMIELTAVTNGMASTSLDAMSEASIEPTPLQGGGYSYQRIGISQPRHEGRGSGATNQFRHANTYDIQSNVDGSVEDVGSIADQVDALIEEERYRLPQDE